MSLQSEMAKLIARKIRIEKCMARVNEFPCPNRAYLNRRMALLADRHMDVLMQIDAAQAKAGTT